MEGEWTDNGGYDLITVPKVIANCKFFGRTEAILGQFVANARLCACLVGHAKSGRRLVQAVMHALGFSLLAPHS